MNIARPENPMDRRIAIMELFDTGRLSDTCTVQEIVRIIGGNSQATTPALRTLKFTIARRESTRREPTGHGRRTRKVKIPRQWAPPVEGWDSRFKREKQLREYGMSPDAIRRAEDYAAHLTDVLSEAVDDLLAAEVPVASKGRLKRQIQEVIREKINGFATVQPDIVTATKRANDAEERANDAEERLAVALATGQAMMPEDVITRSELADALKEHHDTNKEALLNRTRGVVRAAVRKGNTTLSPIGTREVI